MRPSLGFQPRTLIPALWILWLVIWLAAARWRKKTRWRAPARSQMRHLIPLYVCMVLLAAPRVLPRILDRRFLPPSTFLPWLGTVFVAAGLALALWARWHLAGNWSGIVTLKEGHTLVTSGPYGVVRHPIYTGLLLGFLGTALAIGEWRGLLAVAFAVLGFVLKLRVEEEGMRRTFPDYGAYCRETAALVPLIF
jgi:protein-S-isoprenylcysteine O-methyltransferase Ste14